jgi:hypothetical protein
VRFLEWDRERERVRQLTSAKLLERCSDEFPHPLQRTREMMTNVFGTIMFKMLGWSFERWSKWTKALKAREEMEARARKTMSRCLTAIGQRDYFKAFKKWKEVRPYHENPSRCARGPS